MQLGQDSSLGKIRIPAADLSTFIWGWVIFDTEARKSVAKMIQTSPKEVPNIDGSARWMAQLLVVQDPILRNRGCWRQGISYEEEAIRSVKEQADPSEARRVDEDGIIEAVEEHGSVNTILRKLSGIEVGDESFYPKIKELKELIEHHVNVNGGDSKLFPECQKSLGERELIAWRRNRKVG
jgi:hypothetical protein